MAGDNEKKSWWAGVKAWWKREGWWKRWRNRKKTPAGDTTVGNGVAAQIDESNASNQNQARESTNTSEVVLAKKAAKVTNEVLKLPPNTKPTEQQKNDAIVKQHTENESAKKTEETLTNKIKCLEKNAADKEDEVSKLQKGHGALEAQIEDLNGQLDTKNSTEKKSARRASRGDALTGRPSSSGRSTIANNGFFEHQSSDGGDDAPGSPLLPSPLT